MATSPIAGERARIDPTYRLPRRFAATALLDRHPPQLGAAAPAAPVAAAKPPAAGIDVHA